MVYKTLFIINTHSITLDRILKQIAIPLLFLIIGGILAFYIIILLQRSWQNIYIHKKGQSPDTSSQKKLSFFHRHSPNPQSQTFERKLKKLIKIVVFIGMLLIILLFIGNLYINNLSKLFLTPFYTIGNTSLNLIKTLLILLLGYGSYLVSMSIRRIAKKLLQALPQQVAKRYYPIIQLSAYATLILSFIIGLSMLGVNLSSFSVVFGVLGVGLGFGLQDIVSNFFSGLVITFSSIITEGDRIFVQGIEGNVIRINLINTVIRSLLNDELIVPNKTILNEAIQNYSHSDRIVVINAKVGVSYNSDMHKVKSVLIACGEQVQYRMPEKEIIFRLQSFGDSGINVAVFVWIYNVDDKYQASSDLHMIIWEAFKTHNIEIPFPQMDIHIKANANTSHSSLSQMTMNTTSLESLENTRNTD